MAAAHSVEPAAQVATTELGGRHQRDWMSVPSDLENIFAAAGDDLRSPDAVRGRVVRLSRRDAGISTASLGAIVATGLIGLAVGAMLPAGAEETTETKAAPAALSMPLLPVEARTVIAAASPGSPAQPARPAAADSPRKAPTRAARASTRSAALAAPIGGSIGTPRPAARPTPAEERTGLCERSRCSYAEVLTADRRLRRAYDDAVSAGVPRKDLVNVRNRWSRVRSRADDDPAYVVTSFSSLERDLNKMAVNARRRPS